MAKEIRVADYIAEFIYKKGVEDFFLLPGGGAMFLVDALGNYEGINFVPCHHEQSASISAEAYSRVTENFGVALVTTGPGATNAITGAVGAWIESVPMMVISGQVKRSDMVGSKNVRQCGAQEVDIISMVKGHTKYAITIDEPEKIKYYLEKAYYEMMNGRKGPVWIDVPLDIQSTKIDPDKLEGFIPEEIETVKLNLVEVIEAINSAKRPLILAGHGIRLANASEVFKRLVEQLKIPVTATWNAMDLVENDNKYFAGKPGVVALRAGNFAVQNCDLLIAVGSRVDNIITAYNKNRFAKNAKKIIVDIDQYELKIHSEDFHHFVQSDAKSFLDQLESNLDKIDFKDDSGWIEQCNKWKNKYTVDYEFDFDKNEEISHFQFADILSKGLKGGELVVTGSSGLGIEAFYTAFNVKKDQRVFLTSGLGSMGYGLPAAIGASIANKGKFIVAVESDGSLQLNIQELATLKNINNPIAFFIMDNSGYASIRNTQRNYFDGRYVATGEEGGLLLPDLKRVCDAYELDSVVVEDINSLEKVVEGCLDITAPKVIIVKTMKNEVLQPKASAMPQPDGNMISMPLEDMTPLLPLEELRENMNFELDENSYKARNKA